MIKCPVLKELKLSAKGVLSWEAVDEKETNFNELQRKRVAELERRMENSDGHPASSKTAPRKHRSRKREKHGRGSESSEETSGWEVSRPEVDILKEVQNAEAV